MTADLLRRAASHLYQRAKDAQHGPWHIGNAVDPMRPCNVHTFPGARLVADNVPWLDAEYIATMHPPVAVAIAGWLFAVAIDEETEPETAPRVRERTAALIVARAIIREPEQPEDGAR
ncbi:hypothetical protein Drose_06330 [Dactylosporangium roseum]|uniref:Uncharacterized protein n=1 Tax=Dactylosporangium roseum TaxID=47989 RepID=A0ABY5ZC23_9ACTN|nr:hypothetical protein [Dactylosporangium roseum]UWZ37889.1 hypothetical protein Drose_06330 [Dactylosporangium roseum]